jgi:hypothetical protein
MICWLIVYWCLRSYLITAEPWLLWILLVKPWTNAKNNNRTNNELVMSKSKLCYDRRWVGQSVLVSSHIWGPKTRFLLMSDRFGFVHVGRPLWRVDGSVVYNCCWSSPAQLYLLRSKSVVLSFIFTILHVGILHIQLSRVRLLVDIYCLQFYM